METIYSLVCRLNEELFLPAIQREYVWGHDNMARLIDSILMGYPISSFLFWQVEDISAWDIYEFIKNYTPKETRNEQYPQNDSRRPCILVLDGQQRLTSLNIALRGTYTRYGKRKVLHMDLLKPRGDENSNSLTYETYYTFKLINEGETPDPDVKHYWFSLARIFGDFQNENEFNDFRKRERRRVEDLTDRDTGDIFDDNLRLLYSVIHKPNSTIKIHTERQNDLNRVLDIFARTNMGGMKLTKSDLLLSMATAKWDGLNARQQVHDLVDRLNKDLDRKNNFDKDFILKSALAIANLPVRYSSKTFTEENLSVMRENWKAIHDAIERTVKFINSIGLDRDTLTSANALIPVACYIHRSPKVNLFDPKTTKDKENRETIRIWLLSALFNRVFSGQSDSMIANTRNVIYQIDVGDDFPVEALNRVIRDNRKFIGFDDEFITKFLEIEYGSRECFLALSLLYDEKKWGAVGFHKDHIFPQAMFKRSKLEKAGVNDEQVQQYIRKYNRIGNLQLLTEQENKSKSDTNVHNWLSNCDPSFRAKHLIPEDTSLWNLDHFMAFIEAREELIRQRLHKLFGKRKSE